MTEKEQLAAAVQAVGPDADALAAHLNQRGWIVKSVEIGEQTVVVSNDGRIVEAALT